MRLDEFFLVFHFVDAYGARLRRMAAQGGVLASKLLLVDLDELLDSGRLIRRERERVAREAQRLSIRIEESQATSELARRRLATGADLEAVIAEIEKRYPYELNSQRPLNELLSGLPGAWRREELADIAELRARRFWEPLRQLLLEYDEVLERLTKQPRA